ncbi:MAG TPA: amidase [Rectinemataceae bacterium]|nr:amidase [Rectinemataceae bacterium]
MKDITPMELVDRLRLNLRDAAIGVGETDFGLLLEKGFLNSVLAFETAVRDGDASDRPEMISPPLPKEDGTKGSRSRDLGGSPEPHSSNRRRTDDRGQDLGLLDTDIDETARRIEARELSPIELVDAALSRIGERNDFINAFQLVMADAARLEAEAAQRDITASGPKSPLHGIPVAVKDIFDIEGLPTRAGSLILGAVPAKKDSHAVSRLKNAGAIIVGKTSLPEFSFSPGSNNDHFGATRNPLDPERDSGGSSAGSAAAVADGMALGALGSDSGGSTRIPASFCGLVGLKPAWSWSSLGGTAGLSWSLDTLGILSKSVRDALLIASVLDESETWKRDVHGLPSVSGLCIGAIRGEGRGRALADPDVLKAWEQGLSSLREAGATIVDIEMEELPQLRAVNGAILAMEAAALHREMQSKHLDKYGEFARLGLLVGWAYGPTDYLRARQLLGRLRAKALSRFESIDLLCSPTMTSEATLLGRPPKITLTAPFNALGWPAISIPGGRGETGLPVGFQLVARPGDEASMLAAAFAVESGWLC